MAIKDSGDRATFGTGAVHRPATPQDVEEFWKDA